MKLAFQDNWIPIKILGEIDGNSKWFLQMMHGVYSRKFLIKPLEICLPSVLKEFAERKENGVVFRQLVNIVVCCCSHEEVRRIVDSSGVVGENFNNGFCVMFFRCCGSL